MKKLLLLLISCLPLITSAQTLTESRRTSYYTYIFQLTAAEAKTIYQKDLYEADQKYFHAVIDSFPTGTGYQKKLPYGNYLFTYAEGGELVYELQSVNNVHLLVVNNKVDLSVLLTDSLGRTIPDASVKIRNKRLPFHTKTGTYLLSKARRKGIVSVTYQDVTSFHQIDNKHAQPFLRKVKKRILYTRPVYWVWKPFSDIVSTVKYGEPNGWLRKVAGMFDPDSYNNHEQKYRGYIAFNKPIYLPRDTVKLKAYILNKRGKPIRHALQVQFNTLGGRKTLTTLQPYRKGAYAYEFVLKDSLQLQMDRNQGIWLQKKKYKTVMYGSFNIEEYEIKSNTFTLRSDKTEHRTGEPMSVYVQGKDENELNVPDASVQLTLVPKLVKHFSGEYSYVKDTLWQYQQNLDPVGETRIALPDSIFPALSFEYTIQAAFLNASQERHEHSLSMEYIHHPQEIKINLENDTLLIDYLVSGKTTPAQARLTTYTTDTADPSVSSVQLPYKMPVNPFAESYYCKLDTDSASFYLNRSAPLVQCYSNRTADSVSIWVENPRKLPLYYTIYRKNQVLERGSGTSLDFARKTSTPASYFVSLQFMWAGQIQEQEFQIPFQKNNLNIEVNQPQVVQPGQKANIEISVTDAQGDPAADVDVTAYAITKKFKDAYLPQVPYLGKYYPARKSLNSFQLKEFEDTETKKRLNWQYWNPEMGLDSIAYYQFLYPANGLFSQYISLPDSAVWFAPFVVWKGELEPVYLIYLDGKPVYYKDASIEQRYAFSARSGYHTFILRTAYKTISIDSVLFKPKTKLVLSIDLEKPHPQVNIQEAKRMFSAQEQQVLNRYLMRIQGNPDQKWAYIRQGDFIQPITFQANNRYHYRSQLITGVYTASPMQFVVKDGFTSDFTFEPLYVYEFGEKLLKMRSISPQALYKHYLSYDSNKIRPDFAEKPYQLSEIDSLWAWQTEVEMAAIRKFNYAYATSPGYGKLVIHQIQLPGEAEKRIKQVLLFKEDDPDFLQIYTSQTSTLHQLTPGKYKIVLLLYFNYFVETGFIAVQPNGQNFINIQNLPVQPPNEFSRKAAEMVRKESFTVTEEKKDLQQIKENYNTFNISPSGNFTHLVSGRVTAEDDQGLPGVNVVVKGTATGTVTDMNGYYQLYVPANGVLVFSFIGYVTGEKLIGARSTIDIQMQPDVQALQEVVVTGYGVQRRVELLGSVATIEPLSGRVAGVQISKLKIRGNTSVEGDGEPMIILNGVPFNGSMADIDPALINHTEVLKAETATALYGARAANGVILISTISKPNQQTDATATLSEASDKSSSLRHNFSDYAYWQPRLTTNKAGKVSFPVTFPDDVTNWRTFVLAMDHKKRSGSAESSVKSFKPVVSNLAVPRFLLEGDTTWVIGKTTNYTADTLNVSTSFTIDNKAANTRSARLIHSMIDSLQVTAGLDSLKVSYASVRKGGMEDGEMRRIPVFPKGSQETKGIFLNLDTDTTFSLTFDPAMGKVKVFVQDDNLQVLLDEIAHVKEYAYFCNEQMASKLIALLLEKKIRTTLGENFAHEREIRQLIGKLQAAQRREGAWGWWPDSSPLVWISLHVAEALAMAQKSGYPVRFNKQPLQDYLVFEMESEQSIDKLRSLQLLHTLEAKVDFHKYIEKLSGDTTLGLQQHLQLIELRQLTGMPYSLDSLYRYKQSTMLGGIYIGKESHHITDNAIINTVIAYRILKTKGNHEAELVAMRRYFLEKRNTGYWRNTYESVLILTAILPDILAEGKLPPATLSLQGALQASVTAFPYQAGFTPGQSLVIKKENKRPLYFTAYQQYWDKAPVKVENDFVVRSTLGNQPGNQVKLEAGKPVTLTVEVEVKKDAGYVLLEIPIPAGCTYQDKRKLYGVEVHREYDKHKTNIFCQQLKKGKYGFTINLLPRYNGVYTLNPAKAQLMYFPVFYGRNETKQVKVIKYSVK